jgi:hypothetical protein
MSGLDPSTRQRIRDEAGMWCDLMLAHNAAESARFAVTRRAELYIRVAGLPLEKVYDALGTDAAGWAQRLTDLREQQRRNRAAAEEIAK